MDLSIITATYNRPASLFRTCLDVQRQIAAARLRARPIAIEHVVVSDGPSDDNRAVCSQFPHVRYLELPEHAGKVGAVCKDAGIETALGEYVAFWDDDNAFTDHAAVEQFHTAAGRDIGITQIVHRQLRWKAIPAHWTGEGRPRYGDVDTACFCVRREIAQTVRWQDQHAGDDDWHWISALIASGATVRFTPIVIGWHL